MSHCANSVKHYKTLQFWYVFISIFFLYLLNKQIIKHNFALYGAVGVDSWSVTRFFLGLTDKESMIIMEKTV